MYIYIYIYMYIYICIYIYIYIYNNTEDIINFFTEYCSIYANGAIILSY